MSWRSAVKVQSRVFFALSLAARILPLNSPNWEGVHDSFRGEQARRSRPAQIRRGHARHPYGSTLGDRLSRSPGWCRPGQRGSRCAARVRRGSAAEQFRRDKCHLSILPSDTHSRSWARTHGSKSSANLPGTRSTGNIPRCGPRPIAAGRMSPPQEGASMAISEKATEFAGLPVVDYSPAVGLVLPTMSRREFVADGKSAWAIALEGDRLTTQIGKGKVKTKTFRDRRRRPAGVPHADRREGQGRLRGAGGEAAKPLRDALRSARSAPTPTTPPRATPTPTSSANRASNCLPSPTASRWGITTTRILSSIRFLADPRRRSGGGAGDRPLERGYRVTAPRTEVAALIAARDRLPNLRASSWAISRTSECEISWLVQSDLTGLFTAFPKLEHFRSRGGNDLAEEVAHERLSPSPSRRATCRARS